MSKRQISGRRFPVLALSLCSIAGVASCPAAAAEFDDELPAVEVRSRRHPNDPRAESVSTATRTASDPRDVPQTIDSVSVEETLSYGGRTLADALAGVPGVSNTSDTRFDSFRIRGFSSAGDLLLDGMRDDAQYVRSLGNIERVEVLKGPAAALYGRGSGGGVINRITKQPLPENFGHVSATTGSYGRLGASVDLNRMLSSAWSMRLNAGREHAGSFRDHVDGTRQFVAPSIKWHDARRSWLLQFEYDTYRRVPDRGMPAPVAAVDAAGKPLAFSLPSAPRATFFGAAGHDTIRDETMNWRSVFTHALDGDWELRHTLGVLDLRSTFDNTYVTQSYVAKPRDYRRVQRARYLQDMTQLNVQTGVELGGKVATGPALHHLLFGIEYGWQKRTPALWQADAAPVPVTGPDRFALVGSTPRPYAMNRHRVSDYALFAQDRVDLGRAWKLLGGLRAERFDVDSTNALNGLHARRTTTAWSPRLGVVWSPVGAHSLYASYSKNFAPVGGDLIGITPDARGNTNDLGPQYTRQYEIGVKSDWRDGALSTTLALFQLDLYNRRIADPVRPGFFDLTGLERNRGLELSVAGRLTGDWFVRGGIGWQHARVVDAEPKYAGKRSAGVSASNGSLFVSHAPLRGFFAELGVVYEGARYADRDNLLELPAYLRWDGKAGYRTRDLEVTLAAVNLADRDYYANATGLAQIVPGAPRTFTLTAAYKF
ncbi:TonB-dependent receptor [Burkholderia cenocepacia]|uniref:TonB-dependent receptor n=1 Tax=Burkholderia cenocepacia TaxID=95486 RepID=UPI0019B4FDEF|nr:TonB-dependent siderophore receptor [Burkholderia cenocepacia]CAB5091083.1 TonB-dependent receptor [Burkholderia cenocepacia]CAB5097094.1 TonB-dependent receptor [Burkholderia cenocepacia]CAB5152490.1 TonB-dependent receptor [Burkholderia cenocepacia]CAB5161169.1 TonB-dependent receptor [Burkholderia cenocepacia]CAB5164458.1 TonB-dependent receptor [Burkholderia cenocepacia]